MEDTQVNDEVKLGRVGHYAVAGACQEARICYVHEKEEAQPFRVNVAGDSHEGDHFARRSVPVGVFGALTEEFHFNRDCPNQR